MTDRPFPPAPRLRLASAESSLPRLIADAGDRARIRFIEYFAAEIRNRHTRRSYLRACRHFFDWCGTRGIESLQSITPVVVAAYIEDLGDLQSPRTERELSVPTVKQSLAAIRKLFDWLVIGHVIDVNPAAAVRGPKYSVTSGKTPALAPEEVKQLFDSIDTSTLIGLRDRALISVMAFGFARIGAVVSMRCEDYFVKGRRAHFRLHKKGGKVLEIPAHHTAEEYLGAYVDAAGIGEERKRPLFRSFDRWGRMRERAMSENDAWRMVKRRAAAAGLPYTTRNHTFRATSCTTYLLNGGKLEHAQRMMGHSDPRTTKQYDRTSDKITLDEIEKISY